jgi:hypothetical protein
MRKVRRPSFFVFDVGETSKIAALNGAVAMVPSQQGADA